MFKKFIYLVVFIAAILGFVFLYLNFSDKTPETISKDVVVSGDYELVSGDKLFIENNAKFIVQGKLSLAAGSQIIGEGDVNLIADTLNINPEAKIVAKGGSVFIADNDEFGSAKKLPGRLISKLGFSIHSKLSDLFKFSLPVQAQEGGYENIFSGIIEAELLPENLAGVKSDDFGNITFKLKKKSVFKDLIINAADGLNGGDDIGVNCQAKGGAGGDGGNINIISYKHSIDVLSAVINLGDGGHGGRAEAKICSQAEARGGQGGDGGNFKTTSLNVLGELEINPGIPGDGGSALARGLVGETGPSGQPGGDASAYGGDGGTNKPFIDSSIYLSDKYAPGVSSLSFLEFNKASVRVGVIKSGSGGSASAFSGNGGDATECGGNPGPAGEVVSQPGKPGQVLTLFSDLDYKGKKDIEIDVQIGKKGESTSEKGKPGQGIDQPCGESKKDETESVGKGGCSVPQSELEQAYPPDVFKWNKATKDGVTTITFTRQTCLAKSVSSFKSGGEAWLTGFKEYCPNTEITDLAYQDAWSECSITFSFK